MTQNEPDLTDEQVYVELLVEAESLGKKYVHALNEQRIAQLEKKST
jgi:hypothetical protein